MTVRTAAPGAGGDGALRALADHAGILPVYTDMAGRERWTSDDTRVALLAAMGVDASTAAGAAKALEQRTAAAAARPLPLVAVTQSGARRIQLPAAEAHGASVEWTLKLTDERGATETASGREAVGAEGIAALPLPTALAPGYYVLSVSLSGAGASVEASQMLIAAPPTCPSAADVLMGQRAFGINANLYTVRSEHNWGIGNLGDLQRLLTFTAGCGGAFVGVNPLHALRNRGYDVSPYSPVSRLFRNPVYLDVTAVPELERTASARELVRSTAFQREVSTLRAARELDYAAVAALQRPVLELLHATFLADARRGSAPQRHTEYARYASAAGGMLDDFATFCALADHLESARGTSDWRRWPEQYRDPRSPAVTEFRGAHANRVDFHRWLQFELDRQLGAAAAHARSLAMPIGIYQDLAIGTAPDGSDPWAFGDVFVRGASVGAPPDEMASEGQNWGLPPLNPGRLAERGFDYWIALLRSSFRHAGALRIDHALGLFRQFWIADGSSGRDGAYVRYPSEAMLAILAVESQRAGALVVGEDLGTAAAEARPALERWGVLSSRVLYFERGAGGEFRAASEYPRLALATATTHDVPTLAGFWSGRDVALRETLGITDDATAQREREAREADRAALLLRLRAEGLLAPDGAGDVDGVTLRAAVHSFMRRTPSWLVGLALDDLVGEAEPVNIPGVPPDRFRSWTRRLAVPIESLDANANVERVLGVEHRWSVRTPSAGTEQRGGESSDPPDFA